MQDCFDQHSIPIQRLPHAEDLPLPSYGTHQSAGLDLAAAIEADIVLQPGERSIIPTGFSIALPDRYEAQIRSRSGLAAKNGVVVFNSPGTIDPDYRGEIKVILANFGETPFTINRGMRIAQLVIAKFSHIQWVEQNVLETTLRGHGGFGSTGLTSPSSVA